MSTTPTPAGWYPDPDDRLAVRYWDGARWTQHVAPRPAPSVPAWSPEAVARNDAEALRRSARRARTALMVAIPVNTLNPLIQGAQVRQVRRTFDDVTAQLDELETNAGRPGVETQPFRAPTFSPLGNLTSLPILVVGILFVIWFHQAATTAARLGRPARRSPGWAVGGWFVPIGNFFLPYQSAKDLFRPEAAGHRRTVRRWWAAYLGASFVTFPLALLVGYRDGTAAALAVTAFALVIWLGAGLAAIAFVERATDDLAGEAERRAGSPTSST